MDDFLLAFFGGGLTGSVEIMITYPMEFLKSSIQLSRTRGRKSMLQHANHLLRTSSNSYAIFYRGVPTWLLFSFPRSAVRFSCFEQVHSTLQKSTNGSTFALNALSGLFAGAVEGITCLVPCQNISIKMTHDANLPVWQQSYPKFFRGLRDVTSDIGFKGVFVNGVGPLLLKNSIN